MTTQVLDEDYSVERAAIALGVGAVGGAVGAVAIPALAGVAGTAAIAGATTLGATQATAVTVGTATTVVADMTLAGLTNIGLSSAQRSLTRAWAYDEQITSQDIANDMRQNAERDFTLGAFSSALGQVANGAINKFIPDAASTPPGPTVITNVRFPMVEQSRAPLPMNYSSWTPYIRGGAQVTALVLSDASSLELYDKLVQIGGTIP